MLRRSLEMGSSLPALPSIAKPGSVMKTRTKLKTYYETSSN